MFDSSSFLNMNWFFCFLVFMFLPLFFFIKNNRFYLIFFVVVGLFDKDIMSKLNKTQLNMKNIFFSLFFLIFLLNFNSLFPFFFSFTSHLSVTMSMVFPFWFSMIIQGYIFQFNNMLAHMVPKGTPFVLISFMVLIETISFLIRPFTLSIRLTANMIAGHLLINLLSNIISLKIETVLLYILMILLLLLEMSVSLIQSYVFMTLMSLYLSEI